MISITIILVAHPPIPIVYNGSTGIKLYLPIMESQVAKYVHHQDSDGKRGWYAWSNFLSMRNFMIT